ncbi:hypothetical protein FS935_10350 [Metabacillus litoralis]|uniref:Uncharacterized protein n=1 Tax=Metabacillus litoralis TaxID=152268 RepID=A0A5C6W2Z5_9BACI|nr:MULTISPECIES: hypothetical protein [Metabacillus]MBM7605482.1 O-antigen ligase [Metabacillus crassostreae]TXC91287.1 hypothetical protein FS935_10350 [Metabacillus litoralis]
MEQVYGWLIAIVVLVIQFLLSRRKRALWGAIVPFLYLIYMVYWIPNKYDDFSVVKLILVAIGGLAILCSIWINGREYLKKKRNKELVQIELKNL